MANLKEEQKFVEKLFEAHESIITGKIRLIKRLAELVEQATNARVAEMQLSKLKVEVIELEKLIKESLAGEHYWQQPSSSGM